MDSEDSEEYMSAEENPLPDFTVQNGSDDNMENFPPDRRFVKVIGAYNQEDTFSLGKVIKLVGFIGLNS